MLLIRLRYLLALAVFAVGVWFGYLSSSPWWTFWNDNRLEILTNPVPANVTVETGNHKSNVEHNRQKFAKSGKISCMVLSQLKGFKAHQIYATWGRRCDYVMFVSSERLVGLPNLVVPSHITNTRKSLWKKVVFGLSSAYHIHDQADWFLKTDDDTYVVMDNLRALLARHNSSEPLYLGSRFRMSYMSGGAGYVVSKKALEMFLKAMRPSSRYRSCQIEETPYEDLNLGECMKVLKVIPVDTRDVFGRERFLAVLPFKDGAFVPGHLPHNCWYWRKLYYPTKDWLDCCAESAISFHYVDPPDMAIIDFFLYHLSPYTR